METVENMNLLVGFLVVCVFSNTCVYGQTYTYSDVNTYLTDVATGYSALIFPRYHVFEQVPVEIGFQIIGLNDFDEKRGILDVSGFLTITWTDKNLISDTWYSPSKFQSITEVVLDQSEVWLPPIAHYNSAGAITQLGNSSDRVRLLPNSGGITWSPGVIAKVRCDMSYLNFPFDKHVCNMNLTALGYNETEINIVPFETDIDMTQFSGENSMWKISTTNVYNFTMQDQSILTFSMTIQRQSGWHLMFMVFPLVMAAIAINTSLLMPGPRMTQLRASKFFVKRVRGFRKTSDDFYFPGIIAKRSGVVALGILAFAFYVSNAIRNMPSPGNPVSVITYYIAYLLSVTTCSSLVSFLIMKLHMRPKKHIPPAYIKAFIAILKCRYCCPVELEEEEIEEKRSRMDLDTLPKQPLRDTDDSEEEDDRPQYHPPKWGITWEVVAATLDHYAFFVFNLLVMAGTMVFMVILAT